MSAPAGTLIAYATAPGRTASDNPQASNGLYTSELLKAIEEPELKLEDVFKRVRAAVARQTRNEQIPWEASSLTGDFFFVPRPRPDAVATATPARPLAPASGLAEGSECDRLAGIPDPGRPDMIRVATERIDTARAIPACRAAVERFPDVGRYHAQYGRSLLKAGHDVEAAAAFRRAADLGNASGLGTIGYLHSTGRGGVERNDVEAARYYRLAANLGEPVSQGNPASQNSLGAMYEGGRGGLTKDDREAVRLYQLSADQGYAPAQINLGRMYHNGGGGLTVDHAEAVRLFRLAALQGEAEGQLWLGISYVTGQGTQKDEVEALRLFRLASAQGSPAAMVNLGLMHAQGRGGAAKDVEEAARQYRAAADRGFERGKQMLDQVCAGERKPAACPR